VTALIARKVAATLAPAALWLLSTSAAWGQTGPQVDHGAVKPEPEPALPAYHHSIFSWEHSLTTQTLGVGDTPQSADPTYSMGFVAKTRYYLVDNTPKGEHFSLRLEGGLYREFTNSDATTRRGEWDFSDTYLAAVYARRFRGPADTDGTFFEVRPLALSLPTSKVSFDSGRYFEAGALVGLTNVAPLLVGRGPEISSLVRLAAGYGRWFARATVPTNPSLERVRFSTDGRSFASDELSGASLVRDQLEFSARLRLDFGTDVFWTTDASISPAWKYSIPNQVPVCAILTGCVQVQASPDDSRYLVYTSFNTEVSVRLTKAFSIELGYGNAANQLGRDGRRRSLFYSPAAVFYASVSFSPHELVTGSKQLAQNGAATPNL